MYLDDWLIRHQDPVELQAQLHYVLQLSQQLGWNVNKEKLDLTPSRQFQYLGIQFDTESEIVRPALKRIEKLEGCVRLFLRLPSQPAHSVLCLLGHMSSMADFMPLVWLHMRPLQFCLLSQWRSPIDSLED